jgi:hypothetical protein
VSTPAALVGSLRAAAPLTLEQYASLCVELADAPGRTEETLARYRITAAERERMDRSYEERFPREPALRAAWERACATYRDWLARSARR